MNTFKARNQLDVNGQQYVYFDLMEAAKNGIGNVIDLPITHKILLENLLRHEDGATVKAADIEQLVQETTNGSAQHEIFYRPSRVLMQDFTGVPALADLAAMRDAVVAQGQNPTTINPLTPVDLVIDHSVMVDHFGSERAFDANVDQEIRRNQERYQFLKWGQYAFDNFRVVPPGTGICHQVNLEYLAKVVWSSNVEGELFAYPDTLVGTDSHTTMINGLGILGWGVGGIEAEAAMLGQSISMLVPKVVGVQLYGSLEEGITATDVVLRVVELLRRVGVVGCFVEFFGSGLDALSLADRATIANMAPEYGATCGYFPIDEETLNYLRLSARAPETVALVEVYAKQQGLWRDDSVNLNYSSVVELDLSSIEPSLAGPKRPQDRVALKNVHGAFNLAARVNDTSDLTQQPKQSSESNKINLKHGDTVIAAITSCTNTSNPAVMLAAGLLAEKAVARGLKVKPWVKTSLAPGSKVVTEYLERSGLQRSLDQLGFNLVGYGCTTCIGNSGPLPSAISEAIRKNNLVVASVLSGNRNFEGRVHQEVRTNWLASPPLVVAYALAGTVRIDLESQSLGFDQDGKKVYLRDLWPSNHEIRQLVDQVSADMFEEQYANTFTGPVSWQAFEVESSPTYHWNGSTYIKQPPFFQQEEKQKRSIEFHNASILALLGDSITTDHISPAGAIPADSPAGRYLKNHGVELHDFNSFGARRGNHEVMMRGTFGNVRIRNEMVADLEGGLTLHTPTNEVLSIYDAAMRYMQDQTPLVVIAGKEYGTGSSRDWAAKGPRLLGVRAVVAESFERIHRSNLVGMGILPLQFKGGVTRLTLALTGQESLSVKLPNSATEIEPRQDLELHIQRANGQTEVVQVINRIDTEIEIEYFTQGGILQYVLNQLTRNRS